MENLELLTNPVIITLIVIVAIWDAIWKLIGLWKSARNNDLVWFVCIAIFNTVGILPIIYILSKKKEEAANE
ncbi:MAG: DUF5652 family protein [Flavobacteriales bacterium]|jgi:hypothetical protein|nr:DUF5652 family protein [Flavobacteriales bacterium]MCW8912386.1 DUF5652 family protein [Flavobacteriales bacterium]MCW8936470.1 DUF5652 family protein [Flavobacteriales bacterium]MCW8941087.1 DUF5652 family protein [Flavobacteriales bacterium]MCW8967536.1 DUF5652 family protein [Flavobacteriales bacterium]